VDYWDKNFEMLEYTNCLAVVPNPELSIWKYLTHAPQGIYLCSDVVRNRPVEATERFYYAYPSDISAAGIDPLNPKFQPINMVLRGQRDYYAFLTAAQSSMHAEQNPNSNIALDLRRAAGLYQRMSPPVASVFSYPVQLSGPKIDRRIDLETGRKLRPENSGVFDLLMDRLIGD
jgi:hypothetical protein